MIVPALIAGAGLAGWIAGRRSMRRALQTTDGRIRHRVPARIPTAPLAVVHQLHPAPTTRPVRSQRGRRIHA